MPPAESSANIRAACRKDIPAIAECARTATSEEEEIGFAVPPAERTFSYDERLSAAWTEPNKVGTEEVWIAEVDGTVVGYVTTEDRGGTLELVNISVRKDQQGKGVGTALVSFVEAMASDAGKSAVTIGTSQSADGRPWKSLPWWQHLGYIVTGVEENAWTRRVGPGVKEIRMRKILARSGEG